MLTFRSGFFNVLLNCDCWHAFAVNIVVGMFSMKTFDADVLLRAFDLFC